MPDLPRFHLAFPVTDLEKARDFYINTLGCSLGRESSCWIDFYFYGHQIVAHKVDTPPSTLTNDVEGKQVPANHFGVLLDRARWESLRDKLIASGVQFLIEPHIRFEGEAGEQATMFITDPSGNGLEFKSFKSDADIFARDFK
tara:strand:- start:808 stop:1236 length:429 start_codon:yes stop_codon:yes gene_type:complete